VQWVDNLFTEGQLLDSLSHQFSMGGWQIVDRVERLAFPKLFTQPKVYTITLLSEESEGRVTIPKGAVNAYHLYTDGSPGAVVSEEEVKSDGSITLIFRGVDNGASAGSPVTITVWISELANKPDYRLTAYYADHLILKNSSGNLFGIVQLGKLQKKLRHLPGYPDNLPFFIPATQEVWGSNLAPQDTSMFDSLVTEIKSKYMETHTLYLYQMYEYEAGKDDVVRHYIGTEDDSESEVKRAALDMEVYTTAWVGENDLTTVVHRIIQEYSTRNQQGPIVQANHRRPSLETWVLNSDVDYKITNWWNDSLIKVLGFIDSESAFLILNSDTSPVNGQGNAVPSIPIYMGQFDLIEGGSIQQTETFTRSFKIDLPPHGSTKIVTVVSSLPVETARVKVWVSGDMDATTEYVHIGIDGAKQISVRSGVQEEPATNRNQAYYGGEFFLENVAGKTVLNIYVQSDPEINLFYPVSARVWLEVTVTSSLRQGVFNCCLFAGYAPDKEGFDFDNPSRDRFRETIFPILKKSGNVSGYPAFPSNGVDTVQVKRTKFGAMYQEYFIAWNTPSNFIPPEREGAKSRDKHPRAWNNFNSDVYRFKFNESLYDDRVHVSKAYLVHPEDGVHGTLRNVILCNPLSILNGDELEIEESLCSNETRRYYFYLLEGASPLTKLPGTPSRPAGVGVRKP